MAPICGGIDGMDNLDILINGLEFIKDPLGQLIPFKDILLELAKNGLEITGANISMRARSDRNEIFRRCLDKIEAEKIQQYEVESARKDDIIGSLKQCLSSLVQVVEDSNGKVDPNLEKAISQISIALSAAGTSGPERKHFDNTKQEK